MWNHVDYSVLIPVYKRHVDIAGAWWCQIFVAYTSSDLVIHNNHKSSSSLVFINASWNDGQSSGEFFSSTNMFQNDDLIN